MIKISPVLDGTLPFFTNYACVLMVVGSDPTIRGRDIAQKIGITERAAQRIKKELISCGYIVVKKSGRRNTFILNTKRRLQVPLQRDLYVKDLLLLGRNLESSSRPYKSASRLVQSSVKNSVA